MHNNFKGNPISVLQANKSPRILKADHELASTSASPQTRPSTKPNPNGSVVLVNEKMEFKDFVQQQLSAQAELGHVVGVVGPQGSGKSTLLSMMAANNPHDKFRQYVFRPCTRDAVDAGYYQTDGLSVFISESRSVFIDCRPFNSGAVLEEGLRKGKPGQKNCMKTFLADDLSLLCTLFEVCHTLLFCVDWFLDLNAVQELLRAALFSEFNFRKHSGYPKTTNLVVVQQRVRAEDYAPQQVSRRARLLRNMFQGSRLNLQCGLSMAALGFDLYQDCEPDVSYVLLDELPLWNADMQETAAVGRIPYGTVVERLRQALRSMPRPAFRALSAESGPNSRAGGSRPPSASIGGFPTTGTKNSASRTSRDFADLREPAADDDPPALQPEQMPNIALKRTFGPSSTSAPHPPPTEPWNDLSSLLVLQPPATPEAALNQASLLRLSTRIKEDSLAAQLLPRQAPPLTETQWLHYVGRVFAHSHSAFHNKYFVSNTGRLAPKLLRKLKRSTRFVCGKEEESLANNNSNKARSAQHVQQLCEQRSGRGGRKRVEDRQSAARSLSQELDTHLKLDDQGDEVEVEGAADEEEVSEESLDESSANSSADQDDADDSTDSDRSQESAGSAGRAATGGAAAAAEQHSSDSADMTSAAQQPAKRRGPAAQRRRAASDSSD